MKKQNSIGKTERLLSIYHMFLHMNEVSLKEIESLLPGSKRTFSRDIALLKRTGNPIRFSAKCRAFILDGVRVVPELPQGRNARLYLEKIIRLTTIMDEMDGADEPDAWYRGRFPDVSLRTMQRDFAQLNAIGYRISYERALENYHNDEYDLPIHHYYCDWPLNTYELTIFKESNF
ncbi:MAG: hypothetical protein LBM60_01985 [Clostridium sp.]|jgi:predicted DNA-binding transcriptional regulator YafY|nr:hypothetical protein [Clostridium sp.]